MYATPFCTHEFTSEQLASLEWVVCPCGYHYNSAALRAYNATAQQIANLKDDLSEMVSEMRLASRERQDKLNVSQNSYSSAATAIAEEREFVPRQAPEAPTRPKREIPTISITQWLIMAASVLVLIAGSVFVSNAISQNQFNAYGWYAIEVGLGAAAAFGAIKSRKISILLSNFLAVFSSSMLLSLIMSFGTQIGLGFDDFRHEPPSFWALNLVLVSIATMFAGRRFNNFGWRATSPVALAASGLFLSYGAIGDAIAGNPSAFGWQLISVSATIIGVLVVLRYLRSTKLELAADAKDKEYETDLHHREDKALQSFAFASSIGLAAIAVLYTFTQIAFNLSKPLDFWATTTLGVFWLAGSATIDYWGTPLSKSGEVPKYIKSITWNVAYISLALGLISGAALTAPQVSIALALMVTLALLVAPRYARFVKPSPRTLTVTSWVSLAAAIGWIVRGADHYLVLLGSYVLGFSLVLTLSAVITGSTYARASALITRNISLLSLSIGLGIYWFGNEDLGFARAGMILLFAGIANADIWLGKLIEKRTKTQLLSAGKWVNLSTSALGVILMLLPVKLNLIELVTLFGLLITVQVANLRKPNAYWNAQSIVAYFTVTLGLFVSVYASNPTLGVLTVGAVAYVFGFLEKSAAKILVGLVGIYAGAMWFMVTSDLTPVLGFNYAVVVPSILILGNAWVLQRRTSLNSGAVAASSTVLLAVSSIIAPIFTLDWTRSHMDWAWTYLVFGLASIALAQFGSGRLATSARALALIEFGYGYILLATNSNSLGVDVRLFESLFAGLTFAFGLRVLLRSKRGIWAIVPYSASLLMMLPAGSLAISTWNINGNDLLAIPEAALVAWTGWALAKSTGRSTATLAVDLPLLVASVPVLLQSTFYSFDDTSALWRRLIVGVVVAAFATWRAIGNKSQTWGMASYAGSALVVSSLGYWLGEAMPGYSGPETYTVLFGLLFAANSFGLRSVFGTAKGWLITDLPLAIVTLPSFVYSIATDPSTNPALGRLVVSALVIGAYSYWRAATSRAIAWVVAGFIGTGVALVMAVSEFQLLAHVNFSGPEAYSLAGLVTAFVAIRSLKTLDKLEGTLVTWGLPLTIAIVPSAIYSYNSLEGALTTDQVIRVLAVIVTSMAATIFGVRKGNLGATTAGTLGLALTAVPNLWNRVGEGAAAEIRGLLIAAILFIVLGSFNRIDLVHGNSLLFVGLPLTVALAPAVVNSIGALGHSNTFTQVDWWRFAIVLVSSLTLLIVGALREVGGMFFPGFAGVLVAALPYGFKQVDGASWLLWVVLLLVAATLIWVAMHIEKMRKLGRTPAMWLRELK
jgi:hypothetical protein